MTTLAPETAVAADDVRLVGRIPIRNLWLLMMYASELRHEGHSRVGSERPEDELADVIAELLAHAVETRLRRNLSRQYQERRRDLSRVRGRIDVLSTERRQLLAQGRVACRFEELSIDTPRNRVARTALERVVPLVRTAELAHRCRGLALTMRRLGVGTEVAPERVFATERLGRNDAGDCSMLAAAKLVIDMALPTEATGPYATVSPDRAEVWVRRLFEKAVAGFFDVLLRPSGWSVRAQRQLKWHASGHTEQAGAFLPGMQADIVLDDPDRSHRLIVETKFTSILKPGHHRSLTFDSKHIYQLYAYLRSQERAGDDLANNAGGVLLYPSAGMRVDESVNIDGHRLRFATVDLSTAASIWRSDLLAAVN